MKVFLIIIFFLLALQAKSQDIQFDNLGSPEGGEVSKIELHPNGTIYIITATGKAYRSSNNGISWNKIEMLNDTATKDIDIDINGNVWLTTTINGGAIYLSADDGVTWLKKTSLNPFLGNSNWYVSLISRPGGDSNSPLYAVTSYNSTLGKSSLFKSTNQGATWSEVYTESNSQNTIRSIAVHANGYVTLLVEGKGLVTSSNGNAGTFVLKNSGISNLVVSSAQSSNLVYHNNMLFAYVGELYRSDNNGNNWQQETFSGISPINFNGANGNACLLSSNGTNLFLANALTGKIFGSSKTNQWFESSVQLPDINFRLNYFTIDTNQKIYIGNKLGIAISDGIKFEYKNAGINEFRFDGLQFNQQVIFENDSYILFGDVKLSYDENTWTKLPYVNLNEKPISILEYNQSFLATTSTLGFKLYYSNDNGLTWQWYSTPTSFIKLIKKGNELFALGYDFTFYKSTNGGQSWEQIQVTGTPAFSYGGSFFSLNESIFVSGFLTNGQFKVCRLNLATNILSDITLPTTSAYYSDAFFVFKDKLMLISRNGSTFQFSRSTDYGESWQTSLIPETSGAYSFFITQSGYPALASATNGTIKISRDFGDTWLNANLNFNQSSYPIRAVEVSSDGKLLVIADVMGLYRSKNVFVIPEQPTDLNLISAIHDRCLLEFKDNANNEDSYNVYWKKNQEPNFSLLSTTSSVDLNQIQLFYQLQPQNTYYFKVQAINEAGSSAFSNTISFTTPQKCDSTLPFNKSWSLSTTNESGLGIRTKANVETRQSTGFFDFILGLNNPTPLWPSELNDLNLATSFSIKENCGSIFLFQNGSSGSGYSMRSGGIWNSATQTITLPIKKVNPASTEPNFNETLVLTLNATDPIPTQNNQPIYCSVLNDTEILVSWVSPTPFASEIIIERSTNAAGPYSQIAVVPASKTWYVDNDQVLTFGTSYFYRLSYRNTLGTSQPSTTFGSILFNPTSIFDVERTNNLTGLKQYVAFADIDNNRSDDIIYSGTDEKNGVLFSDASNNYTLGVLQFMEGESFRRIRSGDLNNDGKLDLIVAKRQKEGLSNLNKLEVYLQGNDNQFFKSYESNLSVGFIGLIDFNEDGLLDILLEERNTHLTNAKSFIYILKNLGSGLFQKETTIHEGNNFVLTTGAFFDYDTDGDIDILLAGQGESENVWFFVNTGNTTFSKIEKPDLQKNTLNQVTGISIIDFEKDGDTDLIFVYSGNSETRKLFLNAGNGEFVSNNSTILTEADNYSYNNVIVQDLNLDGFDDVLFNTSFNISPTGYLYLGNANGVYVRDNINFINAIKPTIQSIVVGDANNDGALDLAFGSPNTELMLAINKQANKNWLKINLVGTSSNRKGIGSKIEILKNDFKQTKYVGTIFEGNISGSSSLTQHIGLGSLNQVNVKITWPNKKIQWVLNVNANQTIDVVEDTTAPSFVTALPINQSTNVLINSNFQFEFQDNALPLRITEGKTLKIYKANNLENPVMICNHSNMQVSNNLISVQPSTPLEYSTQYVVVLEQGTVADAHLNVYETNLTLQFTTQPEPDFEPPVFQPFNPPTILTKGFTQHSIQVQVIDNKQVTDVKIHFRKSSESEYTQQLLTSLGSNNYNLTLAESNFDAMGLEYFLTATDAFNNEAKIPANQDFFQIKLQYQNDFSIPDEVIGVGGKISDWKILSIPFDLPNKGVASVFEELGNLENKIDYKLITYNQLNNSWAEYPSSFLSIFERGKGYFFNIRNQIPLTIGEGLLSPLEENQQPFQLSLHAGWNLIGNPYLTKIDWQDVVTANSLTGTLQNFKQFVNGIYVNANEINPFSGGFVYSENTRMISIPRKTALGNRLNQKSKSEESLDWHLNLFLNENINESRNGIGMHQKASDGLDELDELIPPGISDETYITFDSKVILSNSFVKKKSSHTWYATIHSPYDDLVRLQWNFDKNQQPEQPLYLWNEKDRLLINMHTTNELSVEPNNTKLLFLYGDKAVEENLGNLFLLNKVYPNPAISFINLEFYKAPSINSKEGISIEIKNLMGQTLLSQSLMSNQHGLSTYQIELPKNLSNGIFILYLTYGSQLNQKTETRIIKVNQ